MSLDLVNTPKGQNCHMVRTTALEDPTAGRQAGSLAISIPLLAKGIYLITSPSRKSSGQSASICN